MSKYNMLDELKEESDPKQEENVNNHSQVEKAESKREYGGSKGPEPTRYGDWEHKGRVSDF